MTRTTCVEVLGAVAVRRPSFEGSRYKVSPAVKENRLLSSMPLWNSPLVAELVPKAQPNNPTQSEQTDAAAQDQDCEGQMPGQLPTQRISTIRLCKF